MVFLNQTTMQMTAKIVYYGPGLCGKTTNLQWIHAKTAPRSRGEMVSLETETDRTLFFDLLPLDVGVIGGMKVRLQLYTVPGQVFYNATRRLVLKGVDGVVFVADSQGAALDANLESLANLKVNLEELGTSFEQTPIVFQYNKRDLRNIQAVDAMRRALNPGGAPDYEAAALHGVGVFETLKAISRVALGSIRTRVADENKRRDPPPPPPPAPAPVAAAPVAPAPVARPQASPAPPAPPAAATPAPAPKPSPPRPRRPAADPLGDLVPDPATLEEVRVEFAEEVTGTSSEVRAVATMATRDISAELEKLRATTEKAKAGGASDREMDRLVAGLLGDSKGSRQEVRRKATIDVPSKALRGATGFRMHLVFERAGKEERLDDVVLVTLVGDTRKLDRLSLKLELDLKASG
jgi:signal recognition particle receptor subunit beta